MGNTLTIEEAQKESGYAPFTLRMFARQNKFAASKPKGDRGGWVIDAPSFRSFLRMQRVKGGNTFMKNMLKRGRA